MTKWSCVLVILGFVAGCSSSNQSAERRDASTYADASTHSDASTVSPDGQQTAPAADGSAIDATTCVLTGDDGDRDGVLNTNDNCPCLANADQHDTDTDGVGDVCDNCPAVSNPFQEDSDGNGVGDHCEVALDLSPSVPICAGATRRPTNATPNLYVLLDRSSSMLCAPGDDSSSSFCLPVDTSRLALVRMGLDAVADQITRVANVAVGAFPANDAYDCQESSLPWQLLPMATTDADSFKQAYATLNGGAGTPTAPALRQILAQRLFELPDDPLVDTRSRAVMLVTDGEPNSGSGWCNNYLDVEGAKAAAAALFSEAVPVYVVGIAGTNEETMQAIAVAGGTGDMIDDVPDWYIVSDAAAMTDAVQSIVSTLTGCSFSVSLTGTDDPDYGRTMVSLTIDGVKTIVPRNDGWVYQPTPPSFELSSTWCSNMLAAAEAGKMVQLEVSVACQSHCRGTQEICGNLIDDDCDGEVDEGCTPVLY